MGIEKGKKQDSKLTEAGDELAIVARDITAHGLEEGLAVHPLVGLGNLLEGRGAELGLEIGGEIQGVAERVVELGDNPLDLIVVLEADEDPDQLVVVGPETGDSAVDELGIIGLLVHWKSARGGGKSTKQQR